jgi:hypothetical protein
VLSVFQFWILSDFTEGLALAYFKVMLNAYYVGALTGFIKVKKYIQDFELLGYGWAC